MIIKHTDGSVTDTDKLNDLSAEMLEEIKRFTDFMVAHKVPFILRFMDPVRRVHSGGHNFNQSEDDYIQILASLDHFFIEKGNQIRLVRIEDNKRLFDDEGNLLP